MNPSDKEALLTAGRRWIVLTLVTYALLSLGLWLARTGFSAPLNPVSDYDVLTLLIASITIGGLYAAGLALRAPKARETQSRAVRP